MDLLSDSGTKYGPEVDGTWGICQESPEGYASLGSTSETKVV